MSTSILVTQNAELKETLRFSSTKGGCRETRKLSTLDKPDGWITSKKTDYSKSVYQPQIYRIAKSSSNIRAVENLIESIACFAENDKPETAFIRKKREILQKVKKSGQLKMPSAIKIENSQFQIDDQPRPKTQVQNTKREIIVQKQKQFLDSRMSSSAQDHESIFSSYGLKRPIPTKPISQIIDLNHSTEQAESQNYDGFNRPIKVAQYFQPNQFKHHRNNFSLGILQYNKGQKQKQYFNEPPQVIPKSHLFFDNKHSLKTLETTVQQKIENFDRTISVMEKARQLQPLESKLKEPFAAQFPEHFQAHKELRKDHQKLLNFNSSSVDDIKASLKNIESVQNMRNNKVDSETSHRRTLMTQARDETNTLFQSQSQLMSSFNTNAGLIRAETSLKVNQRNNSELKHLPMSYVNLNKVPFEIQEHNEMTSSDGRLSQSQHTLDLNAPQRILIDDNPYQIKVQQVYPGINFQGGTNYPNMNTGYRSFIRKIHQKQLTTKQNLEESKRQKSMANNINQSEVKEYWNQEYDRALREANFLTKPPQTNENQVDDILDTTDKEVEEREVVEQMRRDEIAEKIDNFLNQQFIYDKIQGPEQACSVTNMQGYEPQMKVALYKAKLFKKLDDVSEDLIASCNWELNKKVVIPKDPKQYRKMVLEQLDVKEDQLLKMVIQDLKNRSLKIRKKQKTQIEEEEEESVERKTSFLKTDFSQSVKRATTLKRGDGSGSPFGSPYGMSQQNKFGLNRAITLQIAFQEKMKNNKFIDMLLEHQQHLLREFFDITEEMRYQQSLNLDNEDIENTQEMLDKNIVEIVANSEAYAKIDKIREQNQQKIIINQHASEVTHELKQKAEAQRQEYLKNQKRLKDASILQLMFGQSRDVLVLKFIEKLRTAVQKKKDSTAQQANAEFIKNILKKNMFNEQFGADTGRNKKKRQQMSLQDLIKKHDQENKEKERQQVSIMQLMQGNIQKRSSEIISAEKSLNLIQRKQSTLVVQDDFKQMFANNLSGKMFQKKDEKDPNYEVEVSDCSSELNEFDIDQTNSMEGSVDDEQYQQKIITREECAKKKAIQNFIQSSIKAGQAPLPILNRIEQKYLPLINYQLNHSNSRSFAKAIVSLVPKVLKKLYLVNNSLQDVDIATIFHGLSQTQGLEGVGLMGNGLGPIAYKCMVRYFVPSKAFKQVKKMILKSPNPVKIATTQLCNLFVSMQDAQCNLRVLGLSRLGFDTRALSKLADVLYYQSSIEQLDISANGLGPQQLTLFFKTIFEKNNLKSLNISYNTGKQKVQQEEMFDDVLCNFLHYSNKLVHFDMSGLGLAIENLEYICIKGIRKSRALQSVHMNGLGLLNNEKVQLRKALRCIKVETHEQTKDMNIDSRVPIATPIDYQIKELFHNEESSEHKDFLGRSLQKSKVNLKNQIKLRIREPVLQESYDDQIVFQRHQGHLEMFESNRWVETTTSDCKICGKQTYTVFVWNKRMAQIQIQEQTKQFKKQEQQKDLSRKFYKHSNIEAIQIPNKLNKDPVIAVEKQVTRMIPLKEFIERLITGAAQSGVRSCNNEIEDERYGQIQDIIKSDLKKQNLQNSYWFDRKELNPKMFKNISDQDINGWQNKVLKLLPHEAAFPVDIQAYAQEIEKNYQSKTKWQEIAEDTYLCAMYLPPKEMDLIIKSQDLQGVNYLRFSIQNLKHLSINTMPVVEKAIRKVQEIRHFKFPTSVFCKFIPDTNKVIHKAFESDAELSKIPKFIKDENDREQTFAVFKKHYGPLKNQFLSCIASKSYPVIDWMDFVGACSKWKLIDQDLTSVDIDRIFIATNFEEEDLEENDDNSLCRFEFLEIIARMAKTKYFEKGKCKTVAESCERMITELIIPNTCEPMEWQPFRENLLWCLDVDDIYKANSFGIQKLYKNFSTNGIGTKIFFCKDDAIKMLSEIGVPLTEDQIIIAYAFSKATIAVEMDEYDNYNRMNISEFYEFIGRAAALLYTETIPLAKKIEKLLAVLLPSVKLEYQPPDLNFDIPSESDCDDDWVDEISQNLMQNKENNNQN